MLPNPIYKYIKFGSVVRLRKSRLALSTLVGKSMIHIYDCKRKKLLKSFPNINDEGTISL